MLADTPTTAHGRALAHSRKPALRPPVIFLSDLSSFQLNRSPGHSNPFFPHPNCLSNAGRLIDSVRELPTLASADILSKISNIASSDGRLIAHAVDAASLAGALDARRSAGHRVGQRDVVETKLKGSPDIQQSFHETVDI